MEQIKDYWSLSGHWPNSDHLVWIKNHGDLGWSLNLTKLPSPLKVSKWDGFKVKEPGEINKRYMRIHAKFEHFH